jgi:hypothetical protein
MPEQAIMNGDESTSTHPLPAPQLNGEGERDIGTRVQNRFSGIKDVS